jgi:hypothetical protein
MEFGDCSETGLHPHALFKINFNFIFLYRVELCYNVMKETKYFVSL